jgi:hypothetical protein
VAQLLLEKGADVIAKSVWGDMAWRSAANGGHERTLQLLLEGEEINVDAKDSSSRTPLSWAAQRGYGAVVQLLLEKGADIMAKECNGWTTLHRAAANGHKEIVQLLLEKGADIEAKNSNGWTAVAGGGYKRTRGGGAAAAEERGQRRGGGWHWTGNYNLTEEFHTQAAVVLSSSKPSEDTSGFLVDRDLWGSARALRNWGNLGYSPLAHRL